MTKHHDSHNQQEQPSYESTGVLRLYEGVARSVAVVIPEDERDDFLGEQFSELSDLNSFGQLQQVITMVSSLCGIVSYGTEVRDYSNLVTNLGDAYSKTIEKSKRNKFIYLFTSFLSLTLGILLDINQPNPAFSFFGFFLVFSLGYMALLTILSFIDYLLLSNTWRSRLMLLCVVLPFILICGDYLFDRLTF